MKKRIFSLLLIMLMILSFAACGGKENKGDTSDGNSFKVNGLEFSLDTEKTFKDLGYRVSGDFKEAEHDEFIPYVQYNYYQEDGTNLLFFRIFFYKDKGDSDALADLGIEGDIHFTDGKAGDIAYRFYAQPRDDGGTIHYYFLSKGTDTYVLNFVSRYDISEFETKLAGSLSF